VCDQLVATWEKIEDTKLMNVTLNGLPKSWEPFVKGLYTHEHLLYWKRLWDAFI
jgi:hypothetical protein